MKICSRCKESKDFESFSKSSTKKDGYQARCKDCAKEVYWTNRDESINRKRQYNKNNKDGINAKAKIYRKENSEKNRARRLKYTYNITLEYYNKMLVDQNGVCAICNGVNLNGQNLSVDHDHNCCSGSRSCGECVRGLLCNDCNWAIGALNDDPDNFDRAKRYILDHRRDCGIMYL